MTVIEPKKHWPIDSQDERKKKGPLIKIEIRPGQLVKMYEADAIKLGHLKARGPAQNKMREPEANKTADEQTAADDFKTIPGIGPAAARALEASGITTFEQLRAAGEIPYLTDKANKALEEWRNRNAD